MAAILALDQGTSSSRSIVFDENGAVLGTAQQEFPQIYPQSGWVEHDPSELWNSQLETARQALLQSGISAPDAIGITNQRETVVLWDRATGEPLHNAIVWQDRRTAPFIEQLKADGYAPLIRKKTGLLPDPYFSATKIAWLLDHIDSARDRAQRGELAAGTVDSWILWNLTKGRVFATDVTNASRTSLFNIHSLDWDHELLDLFRVPHTVLPDVKPSGGLFAEDTLLGAPVTGIAGDQHAALFGQLCTEPGMAKNTYGTGCFILMQTGTNPVASRNRLLTTIAWQLEGRPAKYALEGSIFIAGAAIQWLRDGLGIIRTAPEIDKLAATVPDNGGVTVVPAFTGLGAPHWNPDARGIINGLSRGTTAAHIAYATLESIACQSADVLRAMESDTGTPIKEMRVDGGASQSNLLMQMQADLLDIPVRRPKTIETTALGAAYLAGIGSKVWKNTDELKNQWQIDRTFESVISEAERKQIRSRWSNAVSKA
ncbi:glycerol kinase GlpK [Tichowtungia aerotolerans]|uniref:Glycerol kinase n=1 Tax=Tichowtungia aerotolerans TaxID=2697043 RepID=A0A6P1M7N6_9BACT|nr:glycerol kinase GlpK [Tichowtungia aerotolerans]QHI68188.1 glycerol kinase GlpK [Tichowtungia aerotolerans]